jgi:diaminopimelate decarboxylase
MAKKLSLFPHGTMIDGSGNLTLRGHRAAELAARYGTPLYIYDVETIRHKIAMYRQVMVTYPGESRLSYASKAFLCCALVQLMIEERVGLDVASAGEIFVARYAGANPDELHLHGNNKTPLDLKTALQAGLGRIVVDNVNELELLTEMAAAQNQQTKVWLRVTPDVAVKTHHRYTVTGVAGSKFGFTPDQVERIARPLLAGDGQSALQLTGLHVHLGSHFADDRPVVRAVDRLLDLAHLLREKYSWSLRELCLGGGWGQRYHPSDRQMLIKPFVISLVNAVEAGCRSRGLPLPTIVLEPGRSLVAQAGVALYTVGSRKVVPGVQTYVNIDGGLADNPRPALYQAQYTALLANRASEAETETVAVAGPFCESGDLLTQAVDLPVALPGDTLAVPVAGAYHLSMASNYNGALKPTVVFIDGDEARVVQQRETFEDLVRRDKTDSYSWFAAGRCYTNKHTQTHCLSGD